jgi:hypothetical protein
MSEHPLKTRCVAREELGGMTWKEILKQERSRLLKQRINEEMVVSGEQSSTATEQRGDDDE